MKQPPSLSSEGQQPFYCLPTEMPLCQSHTTTKTSVFIVNLVPKEKDFIVALSLLQVWSTVMLKWILIHHYYSSLHWLQKSLIF